MEVIKLSAIDSTNLYLKKLAQQKDVSNYTVVTAKKQFNGKGQLDAKWFSEYDKNLIFSILIHHEDFYIHNQFNLSIAISCAVFNVLSNYVNKNLKIKWPNDIMSAKDKLAGILIENRIKNEQIMSSIIGIGINVNQLNFNQNYGKATSLRLLIGKSINRKILLEKLVNEIKAQVTFIKYDFTSVKYLYIKNLYQFNKPAMYKQDDNLIFMGKITDVKNDGLLEIERENGETSFFDIKKISFL